MNLRTFKHKTDNRVWQAKDLPASAALRLAPQAVKLLSEEVFGFFGQHGITGLQEMKADVIFAVAQIIAKNVKGDELTDFIVDFFRSTDLRIIEQNGQDADILVADHFDEVFSRNLKEMFLLLFWLIKELFTGA